MSKPVKRVLVVGAILAAAFLVFVLPGVFLDGWLRGEVTRRLASAVKRPVSVGDVGLSTWMGASVVVKKLEIGNREGFSRDPFLAVKEFRLKVRLLPLLAGRIAVEELSFAGVEANLERAADGRANWEDLVAAPGAPAAGGAHGLGTILAAEPSLVLSADTIRCRGVNATCRDAVAGGTSAVRGLELDFNISRFALPREEGPLPLLRAIDGAGQVRIGALEHPGVALDRTVLDLSAASGKFSLKGTGANRAGGSLSFDVGFDATPAHAQTARLLFDRFVVDQAFSDRYLAAMGMGLVAGASAVLDGKADLAATGFDDPDALWLSAAGSGKIALSGISAGQLSAFEQGFARLKGSLGSVSGLLKPETFARIQGRLDDLSRQAVFGVEFTMTAPKVENRLSVETASAPVLSVPGELEKATLAIRYTVTEESFGDPELRDLWREYVGEPHVITGTATAPDWNQGKLMDRVQKRALANMFRDETDKRKEKVEDEVKDQLKDQLEDLNPFRKKKKR